MSTGWVVEVLWGVVGILMLWAIYTTVVIRRMHNMMRSMSLQMDELLATHVVMQDHLDRVARQLVDGEDMPFVDNS